MQTIFELVICQKTPFIVRVNKIGRTYEVTTQEGNDLPDGVDIRSNKKEAIQLAKAIAKHYKQYYN